MEQPKAAGIALHALDTGRVLFIQRALVDGETNGGLWEIPGGKIDPGETAWDAAQREFGEEVGHPLPSGEVAGTWVSPNGVYQGFCYCIEEEASLPLDRTDPGNRAVENPDNPGGSNYTESMAWMDPALLDRGPRLLRPEMRMGTPWRLLKNPVKEALVSAGETIVVVKEGDLPSWIEDHLEAAADGGHKGMVKLSTGWAFPINNEADLRNAMQAFGRSKPQDREKVRRHIASKARQLGVEIDDKWEGSRVAAIIDEFDSLVASLAQPAATLLPEKPLPGPTPYTVDADNGTADGHLCLWASCHIGYPGCVTPPREDSFDFYNLGDAVTADGRHVPVGKITIGTGHAGGDLSWRAAAQHYDESGTGVAVAHAVADRWGIRLPSVLVSSITGEQIDELRRSPLSGDWRRINHQLRLVASLGVNVPGYPVVRALVAAGEVRTMYGGFNPEDAAKLVVEADGLAAELGLDFAGRAEALRASVVG